MRLFLLALVIAAASSIHAAPSPQIIQASDPVRPDEAVLVIGEAFGKDCRVELAPLSDGPATAPLENSTPTARKWTAIQPLQSDGRSLKFVIPKAWPQGVWTCRVRSGSKVSESVMLNEPNAWWWNGDEGETATPGGWLRVFGKSLNFGGESLALLRAADGKSTTLTAQKPSNYALAFTLPADLAVGDYQLFVHNGLGGRAAWTAAGTVNIRPGTAWPTEVISVRNFGPKPADALIAALAVAKTKGGGVVYLPRGRYPVYGPLIIPPNTILRGESMELTSLYWPDYDQPPADLIKGVDFGIESLSIYCQNHKNVIGGDDASKRFILRKVRIRANCYFLIEDRGKEFQGRHGPSSHRDCGAAVKPRGKNIEITDCDIYASNYGLHLWNARTGIVARNIIRYGGRGYSIENTERLIFEDNLVEGNNLLAIGNDISSFFSPRCWHVYFAHNKIRQVYGADREMMTLDAGGGAYYGKLAKVSGTRVTLAADPVVGGYAPKPRTDWTDGVVQILDGKGAGQYRFVTANKGREWQIDRPWTVEPDQKSRVSIAPFRGQSLFIGNELEDGGPFQLYAAAHDCIVAENKATRTDGFMVWGLNPHAWGHQPSWFCQFLDNEIVEGNSYGHRTGGFSTIAYDEVKVYDGPLVCGAIFRRNVCQNNASFRLSGATANAIIEHCTVRHAEVGIKIAVTAVGTLLRDNTFEDVEQNEISTK